MKEGENMSRRHVESSREIRLWLTQIGIPIVSGIMIVSPEAREWARNKINDTTKYIKSKFGKKD